MFWKAASSRQQHRKAVTRGDSKGTLGIFRDAVAALLAVVTPALFLTAGTSAQTGEARNEGRCGMIAGPRIEDAIGLASDNEFVYIATERQLTAYSPVSGHVQWVTSAPNILQGKLFASNKAIVALIETDGTFGLLVFDQNTGLIRRRIDLGRLETPSVRLFGAKAMIASGTELLVFDLEGEPTSLPTRYSFSSAIRMFLSGEDRSGIVVTSTAVEIIPLGVDAARRSFPGDFTNVTAGLDSPAGLLLGTSDGSVSLFRHGDMIRKWTFRAGGRISSLGLFGNDVLTGSHDNFLYRLDLDNGTVEWKKRSGGRILFSPAATTSFLLVTDSSSGVAEVIDLRKGKSVAKISYGADAFPTNSGIPFAEQVFVNTTIGIIGFDLGGCK